MGLKVSNPIISYEIVHARSHFTLSSYSCVVVVVVVVIHYSGSVLASMARLAGLAHKLSALHGKYDVSNLNCRQSNCSAGTTN